MEVQPNQKISSDICINKILKYWLGVQQGQSYLRGEGAPLALVAHPSSDGIMTRIHYGVEVLLHRPATHSIFSYWVGQN